MPAASVAVGGGGGGGLSSSLLSGTWHHVEVREPSEEGDALHILNPWGVDFASAHLRVEVPRVWKIGGGSYPKLPSQWGEGALRARLGFVGLLTCRAQASCSDGVAGPSVVGTPPATAPLGERQQTPLPLVQLTGGVRASARLRAQPCAASSASARDVGITAAARTACQVSLAARPPPGP